MKGMLKCSTHSCLISPRRSWQALVNDGTVIMVQDYPVYDEKLEFADEEATFEKIIAGIKSIRNCRGENERSAVCKGKALY